MKPGIYDDIGEDVYHADPCEAPSLSASLANILIEASPRHAWTAHPRLNPEHEPATDKALDKGSAAHALMLGRGREILVVAATDWRTKDARTQRDAAREKGLTPVLARDYDAAVEMVRVARAELALTPGCERVFRDGAPERVLIWREPCGIWCRAMLDWIEPDGTVDDYKTTSGTAAPMSLGRKAADAGWDVKQAFYERGMRTLGLATPRFRFIVQENYEPHALAVLELDAEALHYGRRKVEAAVTLWRSCLAGGFWPSYPRIVHRVDMPAYALAREEQREVSRESLAFSMRAQEPV
jgi:hypothetical protein